MTTNTDTDLSARPPTPPTGWAELRPYAGSVTVLAGGILTQALTIYLTASLLPSTVSDIGGQDVYAWVTTAYLLCSVVSATLVSRVLAWLGGVRAYLVGLGGFAAGSLVCALAPNIATMLVGRALQGLGGGLLAGLAFALVRSALPERLWGRGSAVISAMFGIGTLVGPAVGGLFAEWDAWRGAFATMAVVTLALATLVPRVLPRAGSALRVEPFPAGSLLLLLAATTGLSLAGIVDGRGAVVTLLALSGVLLVAFLRWDRGTDARILPAATYLSSSSLRWVLLANALTTVAVVTEAFTPMFGQRIAGLPPLAAGFLGATISAGWAFTGLFSAHTDSVKARRSMISGGAALVAAGLLAACVVQVVGGDSSSTVAGWGVALVVAGVGIGLAFPHLTVAAMSSSRDETEAGKAAAAIPTVGLIAQTVGAAFGGLLVNAGLPSTTDAARNLFLGLGMVAALGTVAARASLRALDEGGRTAG
ncbi:MFS transporter [Nocardioides sp. T2.26MG-1]|uniref:MFS transporter n=1 Tax=Nocardioides sp. T2.26MG-1 TaxID=3041166 RepID=UPI0024775A18|nr:MFS transporter [Nocardioides sp. T2.26MG-1]CAI9418907.1 putative multidrug-efflux transporter [Nocardioides sp. T2.26MG-1]